MGLGPYSDFNLAEARARARAQRQLLHDGVDPLEAKRAGKVQAALAAAATRTFEQCALSHFDARAGSWRNERHRRNYLASLQTYVFPLIGSLPVGAIDTPQVLAVMEQPVGDAGPFWRARAETAQRVRGRIEAVLDWAKVRGYRAGDNPAHWKGHLDHLFPREKTAEVKHLAAMAYSELPNFMAALREREDVFARAFEFLILCSARSGEVLGARWPEINFQEKVWTIPGNRMKGGKQHRVALSQRAVDILQALPREASNEFVFVGTRAGRGLGPLAFNDTLKKMKVDVTTHGFRSSFRDWTAERTNFPREAAELALAHSVGDATEKAYARGDQLQKRFALAEAWARFCTTPAVAGKGKVLLLRERVES